tara:strand:- start:482 stop:607 length:126 start_codon:yes stop_codon:yes gene_type:complete
MINRIYFKGVKEEIETPKQRIKRKQKEFLAKYELYKMSVRG